MAMSGRMYIHSAVGSGTTTADGLTRLADLREKGVVSDAKFASLKVKALS
jgi:hypothetical protein